MEQAKEQNKEELVIPNNVSDNVDIFLQVARKHLMEGNQKQIEVIKMEFFKVIQKKLDVIKQANYQIELVDLLFDFVTKRGNLKSLIEDENGDFNDEKKQVDQFSNFVFKTFQEINQCTMPYVNYVKEKEKKQILLHIIGNAENLNKEVAPKVRDFILKILKNSQQDQLEEEFLKTMGNVLNYLSLGSTLILKGYTNEFLSLAIKHKSKAIFAGCSFKQQNSEYKEFLDNHFEEFLDMFENEMDVSTQNQDVMRKCLEYLIQQGELEEINYLQMLGQALKSLCHGGEKQKQIAKLEFMDRLQNLKNSTNQQLSQEISELIQILNK
ncbi:hypothetical protein PPERSA_02270 [Pseudocohnilembus persalinus]|uniref:Armadillo-type fold n=1 Tax=Pseudocohnilembus persalinus TaxID=266149 RepID=A0A0V0QKZ0_PSEPJ|nr:hypothetical protein PPERSA_02270 [Pseudocohnilembus persalinus]|eukprot:KRX02780.1 hypothetical protein PPERSA_02270 [Pseudocohnilembus persalinus]